jgi:hypothetical protein
MVQCCIAALPLASSNMNLVKSGFGYKADKIPMTRSTPENQGSIPSEGASRQLIRRDLAAFVPVSFNGVIQRHNYPIHKLPVYF